MLWKILYRCERCIGWYQVIWKVMTIIVESLSSTDKQN